MRILLLYSVLIFASRATAGPGVSYTIVQTGGWAKQSGRFEAIAEPPRIRADAVRVADGEAVLYDSLLSTGHGPIVALNSRNQTWYHTDTAAPFAPSSYLLRAAMTEGVAKHVQLDFRDIGAASDGEHRYAGKLTYAIHGRIAGELVRVFVTASLQVVTTDQADRAMWLGRTLPVTGYPTVDAKLADADATVRGFPTRVSLYVERRYAGGAAFGDSAVVETTDLRRGNIESTRFERPAGYQFQKPIIAAPGQ